MNGLDFADDLFNKLSKGSSYFIPKLKEANKEFQGKAFAVAIHLEKSQGSRTDQQTVYGCRMPKLKSREPISKD